MKHIRVAFRSFSLLLAAPAALVTTSWAQEPAVDPTPAGTPPAPTRKSADGSVGLARLQTRFEQCDADKSGQLSDKEALQAGLGQRDFPSADLDKDQQLSADEYVLGFHKVLVGRGTKMSPDLVTEAARLQAAIDAKQAGTGQTKPATTGAQPAPAQTPAAVPPTAKPATPPAPAPANPTAPAAGATPVEPGATTAPQDPKASLESKVDQALREAKSADAKASAPAAERARHAAGETPAATGGAKSGVAAKADEAEAALTRRLRNAEVDPATASDEHAKLRKRIANATGETSTPASSDPNAPAVATPASGATSPASLEEKAKATEAALVERMRGAGKTEAEIDDARTKLRARLSNALKSGTEATGEVAPSTGAAPAVTTGVAPATPVATPAQNAAAFEEKAKAQETALVERMRNAGKSEAEIEEAKAKLRTRLSNALKTDTAPASPSAETTAPSTAPATAPATGDAASLADKAKAAQIALEKRLQGAGASDEQAQQAREKLQQRIDGATKDGDTKAADTKGTDTKGTDTKPASQGTPPAPPPVKGDGSARGNVPANRAVQHAAAAPRGGASRATAADAGGSRAKGGAKRAGARGQKQQPARATAQTPPASQRANPTAAAAKPRAAAVPRDAAVKHDPAARPNAPAGPAAGRGRAPATTPQQPATKSPARPAATPTTPAPKPTTKPAQEGEPRAQPVAGKRGQGKQTHAKGGKARATEKATEKTGDAATGVKSSDAPATTGTGG